jgi:Fe-S cluster biogenesis protein NfuA
MSIKHNNQDLIALNLVINELNQILNNHNGGVELVCLTDKGVAKVKLTGHCVGCPMAAQTFKYGVERTILDNCAFVKSVEEV